MRFDRNPHNTFDEYERSEKPDYQSWTDIGYYVPGFGRPRPTPGFIGGLEL